MVERAEIMMDNFVNMGKTGFKYIMINDDKNPSSNSASTSSDKDLNVGSD